MSKTSAPWPHVTVSLDPTGRAEVDRMGTVHTLTEDGPDQARAAVTHWIAEHVATPYGRPVAVTVTDPDGIWHVAISPDATVAGSEHGKDQQHKSKSTRAPAAVPAEPVEETTRTEDPAAAAPREPTPAPEPRTDNSAGLPDTPPSADEAVDQNESSFPDQLPPDPEPLGTGGINGARHREPNRARHSFLDTTKPVEIADSGWRGFLAKLGIKVAPSAEEMSRRADERAISRNWPGPRTIAVVNGKGGAGKTPTTVILSALFARYGGSGVLAWDNNETRGTLGWRTEQAPHEAHVLDLLPHTEQLMAPTARASDLAAYVHHQITDKFDVLRSNPTMLASQQRLTAEDFDAVHQVASKYFRIIVVDSGNDESAPNWLRMIDQADQLVVATTTRPDHAEAGILLLDALRDRDEHSRALADNAVVLVSQADKEEAAADNIAAGYDGASRIAVTIPYDRSMRSGWLQFDQLQPNTQRAYLRAAAAVSDGL